MPAFWNSDRTDLPLWPDLVFELPAARETELEDLPRPRSSGRLGALAVAIGLALGGLAFAYWRLKPRQESAASTAQPTVTMTATQPTVTMTATQPTATQPTATSRLPEQIWTPTTPAEFENLFESARMWVRMTPEANDRDLARVIWAFHWRGLPFPSSYELAARPAAREAVAVIHQVIAAARAEPVEPASASSGPSADEPDDEPAVDDAPPIRDEPTPGHFYMVRRDDVLLGDDGIAARALHRAALEAGRRRGWSEDTARSRAAAIARRPKAQADYAELIQADPWNHEHARSLAEGVLLWLPPIRSRRLLDGTRRRQVVFEEHTRPIDLSTTAQMTASEMPIGTGLTSGGLRNGQTV